MPLLPRALLCASMVFSTAGFAEGTAHWGYHGTHGPAHWAAEFPGCGGYNQSPVNITGTVEADLPSLAMNYQSSQVAAVNNGHTVQFTYDVGSTLTVNGQDYALVQFHFHSPSENRVKGNGYPLEAHLVHRSDNGALAVVAVLFNEGEENALLKTLWPSMPMAKGGQMANPALSYGIYELLPADKAYYRFSGSLTTPPCTEGVTWLVMQSPVSVSAEQLAQFRRAMGDQDTNRPVQPLNARVVMQ